MGNMSCCGSLPYKSVVWGIVLALLLGPIGLLYVNWIASLVFMIVGIACMAIGKIGAAVFAALWIISIYWTVIAVERHNRRLLNKVTGCGTTCS